MELSINKYEYVRTLKEDIKITIPEEPFAYVSNRDYILVVPTKYKGELYSLEIIRVESYFSANIQKTTMLVDKSNIEHLLLDIKNRPTEEKLKIEVLVYIMLWFGNDSVPIEKFMNEYKEVLEKYNEIFCLLK